MLKQRKYALNFNIYNELSRLFIRKYLLVCNQIQCSYMMLELMGKKNLSNPLSPLTVSRSFVVKWTHCFVEVSKLIQVVFLLVNYFFSSKITSQPPNALKLQKEKSLVYSRIILVWIDLGLNTKYVFIDCDQHKPTLPLALHILCLRISTYPQRLSCQLKLRSCLENKRLSYHVLST